MLKARSPDITRIAFRGAYYKIWDAFPSISMAEQTADLGPAAGRLRYGVFIAKGARM